MTSYLGTIETSLSPAVNLRGVIMPRLPSVYEEWRTNIAGERAVTKEWIAGEERVAQPPIEPLLVSDQRETPPELHPRMKGWETAENNASLSPPTPNDADKRAVAPESESDLARNGQPRQPRAAGPLRAAVAEARDQVVVRAVLRREAAAGEPEAASHTASAGQGDQRKGGAVAARSGPLIIPQNREKLPISHRRGASETKLHQRLAPDSSEPAEPAVVVTIGRIEVRAVTPPPTARPSPEKRSMMSLDDYLQQRARGAR